jgi:hypothetical protein
MTASSTERNPDCVETEFSGADFSVGKTAPSPTGESFAREDSAKVRKLVGYGFAQNKKHDLSDRICNRNFALAY